MGQRRRFTLGWRQHWAISAVRSEYAQNIWMLCSDIWPVRCNSTKRGMARHLHSSASKKTSRAALQTGAKQARGLTETRNLSFFPLARALHMVMASAAAVASSSREELDNCTHSMIWCQQSPPQHMLSSADQFQQVHISHCPAKEPLLGGNVTVSLGTWQLCCVLDQQSVHRMLLREGSFACALRLGMLRVSQHIRAHGGNACAPACQ